MSPEPIPWGEVRGAEPEAVPASRATRFLRWTSGADPAHLLTPGERTRAAGVGGLMVAVAVMAAGSATVLMSLVSGSPRLWFVPLALFWGALVYGIDRAILAEPDYGDLRPAETLADRAAADAAGAAGAPAREPAPVRRGRSFLPGWSRLYRWFAYALRIVLAVIVALLISDSVCLVIFQPEIRQVIARDARTGYQDAVTAQADTRVAALQQGIDRRNQQIAAADSAVDASKTALDEANDHYYRETGNADRPGFGPLAATEKEKVAAAEAAYRAAGEQRDRDNAALRQQNATDQAAITALRTPGSPEYQALAASEPLLAAHQVAYAKAGWLAQERALRTFRAENQDDPVVVWLPRLVQGLLLLIDLLPLTLKLLSGNTLHHRRVREQAELVRYADRIEYAATLHSLDLAVDQKVRRTRLAADLARERDRRFHDTRTDHLRRPGP
ncbi:DUF4407 domain-containing protein [Kitasatospora sp. NPDC094015]|uniref:DUF4407 domain-containing protein n=1 Tax=Kitasatospora sp. NPDC094015 TaxID=3155205 RepID=UPI00332A1D60